MLINYTPLAVNLRPIQTLGPLIQVTSVIKEVIMKDTFMIQSIDCPCHKKKKKKYNLQITYKMNFHSILS